MQDSGGSPPKAYNLDLLHSSLHAEDQPVGEGLQNVYSNNSKQTMKNTHSNTTVESDIIPHKRQNFKATTVKREWVFSTKLVHRESVTSFASTEKQSDLQTSTHRSSTSNLKARLPA